MMMPRLSAGRARLRSRVGRIAAAAGVEHRKPAELDREDDQHQDAGDEGRETTGRPARRPARRSRSSRCGRPRRRRRTAGRRRRRSRSPRASARSCRAGPAAPPARPSGRCESDWPRLPRQHIAEEAEILDMERLIEAELRRAARCSEASRRLVAEDDRRGIARHQPHQHEDRRQHHEQRRDRQQQPLDARSGSCRGLSRHQALGREGRDLALVVPPCTSEVADDRADRPARAGSRGRRSRRRGTRRARSATGR